ncbi:MAG: hypothetical protein R2932_28550 [Caldilineaceae bacterium]
MGEYANVDFPGVRQVLEETNFERWVTSVPGVPIVSPLKSQTKQGNVGLFERNWLLSCDCTA